MAYGLSYMGSKNLIARELIQQMPRRDYFVDLFAGGGAMWHAAADSRKYSRFIVNEYNALQCDFLRDCSAGIYNECNEWVSSSDFKRDIDKSKFLQCIWSFGCADTYFCAKCLEAWERAVYHAHEFNDYSKFAEIGFAGDTVYLEDIKRRPDWYKKKYMHWYFGCDLEEIRKRVEKSKIQNNDIKERFAYMLRKAAKFHGLTGKDINGYLKNEMFAHYTAKQSGQFSLPTRENYERMREIMPTLPIYCDAGIVMLTNKEKDLTILNEKEKWHISNPHRRMKRLLAFYKQCERLDILRKTDFHANSYDEVEIPKNSLIYCDPPYINTEGYGVYFDHSRFYDWCRKQTELVLVSEYTMPDDFVPIWRKNKCVSLCSGAAKKAEEKLFIRRDQIQMLYKRNGGYQMKLFI